MKLHTLAYTTNKYLETWFNFPRSENSLSPSRTYTRGTTCPVRNRFICKRMHLRKCRPPTPLTPGTKVARSWPINKHAEGEERKQKRREKGQNSGTGKLIIQASNAFEIFRASNRNNQRREGWKGKKRTETGNYSYGWRFKRYDKAWKLVTFSSFPFLPSFSFHSFFLLFSFSCSWARLSPLYSRVSDFSVSSNKPRINYHNPGEHYRYLRPPTPAGFARLLSSR